MIEITVTLNSAITGKRTVLGEARIVNDGTGTKTRGNYVCGFKHKGRKWRDTRVTNFPRLKLNVWHLLGRALIQAGGDKMLDHVIDSIKQHFNIERKDPE